jgi:hypothetical protein
MPSGAPIHRYGREGLWGGGGIAEGVVAVGGGGGTGRAGVGIGVVVCVEGAVAVVSGLVWVVPFWALRGPESVERVWVRVWFGPESMFRSSRTGAILGGGGWSAVVGASM